MKYMGHELQYILCPGRFPEKNHVAEYLKIYNCWQQVWFETFQELDQITALNSDAFTRQDFVGAVFVDGECKAMALFRYADAALPTMKTDSYFANWSELHQRKLCQNGKKVLVCSYFTIHPSARKEILGFAMRDILIGITATISLHTDMDVMTSAARKNRGVEKLTYAWGATPIAYDIPSGHGPDVNVDLAGFYKAAVAEARKTQSIASVIDQLWNERMVIRQAPPEEIEHFLPNLKVFKKAA